MGKKHIPPAVDPTVSGTRTEQKEYRRWLRVLQAFRLYGPGATSKVAAVACVGQATVRVWWANGHPGTYDWGQRSMKDILAADSVEVRVAAAAAPGSPEEATVIGGKKPDAVHNTSSAQKSGEMSQGPGPAEAAKHREAFIEARTQEAQGVRLARTNALGLMTMSLNLVGAMGAISRRVAAMLAADVKMSPVTAMGYMRTIATITSQSVEVAERAMAMERLLLTEDNPSTAAALADGMSTEEAVAELRRASATYTRLEETGRLTLIHGGKTAPEVPLVPEVPPIDEDDGDEGDESEDVG